MRLNFAIAALILVHTCNAFPGLPVRLRVPDGTPVSHASDRPFVTREDRCSVNIKLNAVQGSSGVGTLKSWDPSAQQAFLQPAIHNKNPVRAFMLVAATVLAARGSLLVPGNLAQFVHLISFAAWMGSNIWVTFIAGITMYRNLPRQTFGKIQSKLFPAYFLLNVCATFAIFVVQSSPVRSLGRIAVFASLVANLVNMVLFEPRSTSIMFKRYQLENENQNESDEYRKLGQEFGKNHGASSLFNLIALMGAFVYAWDLSTALIL